jgi:predicted metal-dependent phosphoesterase TrpH
MLIDMHIHSDWSDGKLSIPEIVDLYGSRGFGAIAITDHLTESFTLLGRIARLARKTLTEKIFGFYIEMIRGEAKRAWREYGMRVIPGYEITKNYPDFGKSAHILGLGVDKYIHADFPCETIIELIHEYGGIAIGAHPVHTNDHAFQTYYLWKNRNKYGRSLDAWETANRFSFFNEVMESGYPVVASSDLHARTHLDGWKTVVTCRNNTESVFEAIKKRAVGFIYYRDQLATSDESITEELALIEEGISRATA